MLQIAERKTSGNTGRLVDFGFESGSKRRRGSSSGFADFLQSRKVLNFRQGEGWKLRTKKVEVLYDSYFEEACSADDI